VAWAAVPGAAAAQDAACTTSVGAGATAAGVPVAAILRAVLPGYPRLRAEAVAGEPPSYRVRACRGAVAPSGATPRPAVAWRQALADGRVFARVVTLTEPSGGDDATEGFFAVLSLRAGALAVDGVVAADGQRREHPARGQSVRALPVAGATALFERHRVADGNDGSELHERVLLLRDGRLELLGDPTVESAWEPAVANQNGPDPWRCQMRRELTVDGGIAARTTVRCEQSTHIAGTAGLPPLAPSERSRDERIAPTAEAVRGLWEPWSTPPDLPPAWQRWQRARRLDD
jgi:hypothetical protein